MVESKLYYDAPLDENNSPYYVPVIAKNKDALVGYLDGVSYMQRISDMLFEAMKIPVTIRGFDLNLDSSKFNDVLPDGTRAGNMTAEELKELVQQKIKEKAEYEASRESNPENGIDVLDPAFFTVECIGCGGYYAFNDVTEIPAETFRCGICDRVLIHFTGHDGNEYQYDQGQS